MEAAPLPASWRPSTLLVYPADPPQLRGIRMNYALGWLRYHQVAVVSERVQTDTYVACAVLNEALTDMLDSLSADFLNERVEMLLGHQLATGYYPRLGLAPGQRFASKGGYLVKLIGPEGTAVSLASDWIVP